MRYERVATFITDVTALVVPGLLQTSAYVRVIMTEGGVPHAGIDALVELRLQRQEVWKGAARDRVAEVKP